MYVVGVSKEKKLSCIYFLIPEVMMCNVIAQHELGLVTVNYTSLNKINQ